MEKIVIANLKMNLNLEEVKNYIEKIKNKKVIICPTAIYATYFIENEIMTGIQNVYTEDKGAFTGEISSLQVKSLGISYVIIGHSERRRIFKEDNELINEKIKTALRNNLKVIFCVGEDLTEDYRKVLKTQITEGLKDVSEEVIIAYEPVWSIGTGKIPINEDITQRTNFIKSLLNYDVKVLYGGSVNNTNIATLEEIKEISGYLIGTASLDVNELINIIEVVQ